MVACVLGALCLSPGFYQLVHLAKTVTLPPGTTRLKALAAKLCPQPPAHTLVEAHPRRVALQRQAMREEARRLGYNDNTMCHRPSPSVKPMSNPPPSPSPDSSQTSPMARSRQTPPA